MTEDAAAPTPNDLVIAIDEEGGSLMLCWIRPKKS